MLLSRRHQWLLELVRSNLHVWLFSQKIKWGRRSPQWHWIVGYRVHYRESDIHKTYVQKKNRSDVSDNCPWKKCFRQDKHQSILDEWVRRDTRKNPQTSHHLWKSCRVERPIYWWLTTRCNFRLSARSFKYIFRPLSSTHDWISIQC